MEIILKLNENEINYILNCLAKEPYIEVVDLINNINNQAMEQLKENM